MSDFDLDYFLSLPRVSGLTLSPDGSRLATTVATVGPDGKKFASAVWELDPTGERSPRRLTRSREGESSARFAPDGALLFTSARPDPDEKSDDKEEPPGALWRLPAGGGEAEPIVTRPAGVTAFAVARDAGTIAYKAEAFPGTKTTDEDRDRDKARKDTGVDALLFEEYPFRFWDHELGPREPRLWVAGRDEAVTPNPSRSLDETDFDVLPDGSAIVAGQWSDAPPRDRNVELVVIPLDGDKPTVLASMDGALMTPACSPDSRWVAAVLDANGTPDRAYRQTLWLFDLATAESRQLAAALDRWPGPPVWAPDSSAVYFCADDGGHTLPFRVRLDDGNVKRLAATGSYGDLCPSPDGTTLFALRTGLSSPPHAVALDAHTADGEPRFIPTPGAPVDTPGRVEEVLATADDGTTIRAWLVVPPDASPDQLAPLVTFIHGGPHSSWTDGWRWRWNPQMLAARGYAVLLPDPALSTGYGQAMVDRAWAAWGDRPMADVLASVDAACARPDIDADRTAAMGGSYGGYLTNWIAGHTDRFRCLISHAGIWEMSGFRGTTDAGQWWEQIFGDPVDDAERYAANSPSRSARAITTPMLVIHGARDYRCPVSEGLQLYSELALAGVDAKFLYFPGENHWILSPPHVRVWYQTVLAYLDHHVNGAPWHVLTCCERQS